MNKHWSNIRRLQSGTHTIKAPPPDLEKSLVLSSFGISISITPLIQRLRPTPSNPLPVYSIDESDSDQLLQAHERMLAKEGLDLTRRVEEITPSHIALYYQQLNKAVWPSPKLALEIQNLAGISVSYLFEACHGSTNNYRPLTNAECRGRSIADIEAIKVHVFTQPKGDTGIDVFPNTWTYYPAIAEQHDLGGDKPRDYVSVTGLEKQNISMKFAGKERPVAELFAKVKKFAPSIQAEPPLYTISANEECNRRSIGEVGILRILVILHALQRSPEWVMQDDILADVAGTNRLRRGLGKSQLSPIHTIKVNADTLRRIEKQLPIDIQHALEDRGAYHIEGLVLVRAFEKRNGTKVKAYARCADETVRTLATEILQTEPVNYQDLAELVRAWGNRSTAARWMQSTITQVKVVRPSALRKATTSSEKPEP